MKANQGGQCPALPANRPMLQALANWNKRRDSCVKNDTP
jgi:hypothetical protein